MATISIPTEERWILEAFVREPDKRSGAANLLQPLRCPLLSLSVSLSPPCLFLIQQAALSPLHACESPAASPRVGERSSIAPPAAGGGNCRRGEKKKGKEKEKEDEKQREEVR